MKLKNNIILVLIFLATSGCSAYGYIESNDYQIVSSQGNSMIRSGRFVPAYKRYVKALQLAEEKNDSRLIAHAKYNLGIFYRYPYRNRGFSELILHDYINKSIKNLQESLTFYKNNNSGNPQMILTNIYIALTDAYDEKGDKKSACIYLNKLKDTYINKLLPHPLYSKKGYYDGFYNPTNEKFKDLKELIKYYNKKVVCGI